MASSRPIGRPEEHGTAVRIPDTVVDIYCNHMQVITTDWDFALLFGTITLPDELVLGKDLASAGEVRIEAIVRTSPQHAKAIAAALNRTIERYEAEHGTLVIRDEPAEEDS